MEMLQNNQKNEAIDKKLIRYLTKSKKFDPDANYFTKR